MLFPTKRSMRIMTSYRMLLRMIGAAIAVSLLNGFGILNVPWSYVVMAPAIAGRRGAGRIARKKMVRARGPCRPTKCGSMSRPSAGRSDGLAVGRKAHRAAGLAPLKPASGTACQSFGDRFTLDCFRARHDPGPPHPELLCARARRPPPHADR